LSILDHLLAWDRALFSWINGFAGNSPTADMIVRSVSDNDLFKGVFVFVLFWGLWFSERRQGQNRLIALLFVAVAAIFVGRVLALSLPFRLRPLHTPGLDLDMPIAMRASTLEGWSSFPSDHAVLFFALATGLFMVSRLVGAVALLHAALVVCLPRIYLGLHYPSDILAGALIGAALAALLVNRLGDALDDRDALGFSARHPAPFYAAMFLVTFQSASMFESLRRAISGVFRVLGL
jgi:undecaprenyl-diphosphatase